MKKIKNAVLVFALLITFSLDATAAEPTKISVSNSNANAGDSVEIVLSVINNPGISSASITFVYDESALTLTDIQPVAKGTFVKNLDANNFSWLKGSDVTDDFDLVKLCFSISNSASGTYTVEAGLTGNLASNITNQNATPVSVTFVAGTVTVEKKEGSGTSGGGGAVGGDTNEDAPVDSSKIIFEDVSPDVYYYDAVVWASEEKITSGTTATTFSPDFVCTRAQAVTLLWRAAGSPEPQSNEMPFEDVATDAYYHNAVLWAVENNITVGSSTTTFSPDHICSRAQIVTFLWRSQDAPTSDVITPFSDVPTDAYYHDAVLWAVDKSITTGSSATTFSPDSECTRAQIVTFLYRTLNDK